MTAHQYILKHYDFEASALRSTLKLLTDGSTIPFIARYRKEVTGGLDEVEVGNIKKGLKKFKDLVDRKQTILSSIEEQGKLHNGLRKKINDCWDPTTLEDIYLPYKKKRKTKAEKARQTGLEGLAKIIMSQQEDNLNRAASRFISRSVKSIPEALEGARHIISEWINENSRTRERIRMLFKRHAILSSKVKKFKDEKHREAAKLYKDYWEYSGRLDRTPSHRLLAIRRAERDGLLSVSIDIDLDHAMETVESLFIKSRGPCSKEIRKAALDAYKRLLKPSIETEFAKASKKKADIEAIEIFVKNLGTLLLEPPLGEKVVIAIDPGFRTGCKVVVINAQGDYLNNTTIYPHPPQNHLEDAQNKIQSLVNKYKPAAIAIGNGTAGRETESFVKGLNFENVEVFLISESGASIYSASAIARSEFPDLDLTIRGAISIGRRLKDPLAELIKIDPKSIGVGQYQHDVDQGYLKESLEETVISCVNKVGINLNTASPSLLSYVSGLGPTIAQRIIDHRQKNGKFSNRNQLLEVKGLGKKAFIQAAGFLRIKDGVVLDNTGVHPERYSLVNRILKDHELKLEDVINNEKKLKDIKLSRYVDGDVGLPTLRDIIAELMKPGHDPRGKAETFSFDNYIRTIEDVKLGAYLPGIIVNVAKFGAFVDLGIKENGLIHISEIANRFISDPNEVLNVNQKVNAKVIGVDLERKRIQLSLKD